MEIGFIVNDALDLFQSSAFSFFPSCFFSPFGLTNLRELKNYG